MRIEQLQQFLKIVEKGSINEAASELFIARSALSASMKRLDAELGEPLFVRNARGVTLTPFGKCVYHQAVEICSRVDFLNELTAYRAKSTLNIASMYCSMANQAFLELLSCGAGEMNASIEEGPLDSVIERVNSGLADIGVITLFSDNETVVRNKIENMGIVFSGLAERQLGAVVGPANPLYSSAVSEIDVTDLQKYPHLENYATPTDHAWENKKITPAGYETNHRVSDLSLALDIVSATDSVMIDADDSEIYKTLYGSHPLRFIPIRDYPHCLTGWIRKKNTELSENAAEYIDILGNIAKSVR